MSQKSITTTTSFIVSSNESLDFKQPLSSSQSTGSSSYDNMAASDLIRPNTNTNVNSDNSNQCYSSLSSSDSPNNNAEPNHQLYRTIMNDPQAPQNQISNISMMAQPLYVTSDVNGFTNDTTTNVDDKSQKCLPKTENVINHDRNPSTNSIYGIYNKTSDNQCINPKNSTSNKSSSNERRSTIIRSDTIDSIKIKSNNSIYGTTSNRSVLSFQNQKANNRISTINGTETSIVNPIMPMNVKGMLLHGVSDQQVLQAWLSSINCEEYLNNFIENGYDIPLLVRMTPQDLTAIGCKSPALRKKLLLEIKKLNLEDDIPHSRPPSLEKWFDLLKLNDYFKKVCDEGYDNIDKVCGLTWEDLEDIGITKLGHQKRLLLGIERIKLFDKKQEEKNESNNCNNIYDVHPNHKMSLHPDTRLGTMSRTSIRSGFFQTRSGANLDHRGLPIATVIPALKHVTNSIANLDISPKLNSSLNDTSASSIYTQNGNNYDDLSIKSQPQTEQIYGSKPENLLNMNDFRSTLRRPQPPAPPVRTDSCRIVQSNSINCDAPGNTLNSNSSIYGNRLELELSANTKCNSSSTSFLRTPKLGTLTATTNKMLTQGGFIQPIDNQSTPTSVRNIVPIREAPLPPLPSQPPPIVSNKQYTPNIQNSISNLPMTNGMTADHQRSLVNQSLIGHQLVSADEFPPPPPCA